MMATAADQVDRESVTLDPRVTDLNDPRVKQVFDELEDEIAVAVRRAYDRLDQLAVAR